MKDELARVPRHVRKAVEKSGGVNWWVVRPAVSKHYPDSYTEVSRQWTTGELAESHRVLDIFDAAAEAAKAKMDKSL